MKVQTIIPFSFVYCFSQIERKTNYKQNRFGMKAKICLWFDFALLCGSDSFLCHREYAVAQAQSDFQVLHP